MTSAVLASALDGLAESVSELPAALKMAVQDDTVLIVVDMVNGFAREGALRSPRIEEGRKSDVLQVLRTYEGWEA